MTSTTALTISAACSPFAPTSFRWASLPPPGPLLLLLLLSILLSPASHSFSYIQPTLAVPMRHRGRGWALSWLQLCCALILEKRCQACARRLPLPNGVPIASVYSFHFDAGVSSVPLLGGSGCFLSAVSRIKDELQRRLAPGSSHSTHQPSADLSHGIHTRARALSTRIVSTARTPSRTSQQRVRRTAKQNRVWTRPREPCRTPQPNRPRHSSSSVVRTPMAAVAAVPPPSLVLLLLRMRIWLGSSA